MRQKTERQQGAAERTIKDDKTFRLGAKGYVVKQKRKSVRKAPKAR